MKMTAPGIYQQQLKLNLC